MKTDWKTVISKATIGVYTLTVTAEHDAPADVPRWKWTTKNQRLLMAMGFEDTELEAKRAAEKDARDRIAKKVK